MPDVHPESVPPPKGLAPEGRGESASGRSRVEPEVWTAAHYCVHCCYAHVVSLPEEPLSGSTYLYSCPITRQDCLLTSRDVSVRLIPGPVRGSMPARRVAAS